MDSTAIPTDILPTSPAPANSESCRTCGARLTPDQRYCLECGERRGDPRLPFMNGRRETAVLAPAPVRGPRVPRSTAGTTLVAGIGTLLLAMGVGVLIGRSGSNGQVAKAPPVQVVTVAGGGAAATAGSATPADAAAGAASSTSKAATGKNAKAKGAKSTPAAGTVVQKKAGTVVKIGSKGKGPGYKNGQFTGDFFGP